MAQINFIKIWWILNTIEGIEMGTFVFATYILALIALAVSLYCLVEIREFKKQRRRNLISKRLDQTIQTKKQDKSLRK